MSPPMSRPAALIIAHGQPSDPEPAEAEIAALAARVQALLPDWHLRSATLAAPGALADRIAEAGSEGLAYPLFMADGWFTRQHLPERLAQAGGAGWQVLDPFGIDPDLQALTLRIARQAARDRGLDPAATALLLAAHGSFRSPAPARVARAMADLIAAQAGFARVEAAFIDQEPRIVTAAAGFPPGSLVLPFFAARGGHVIDDLPEALAEARFQGTLLDPVGLHPEVPAVIASALRRGYEATMSRRVTSSSSA